MPFLPFARVKKDNNNLLKCFAVAGFNGLYLYSDTKKRRETTKITVILC